MSAILKTSTVATLLPQVLNASKTRSKLLITPLGEIFSDEVPEGVQISEESGE